MKKFLSLIGIVALMVVFAMPAMAWSPDIGYTYGDSNYSDSTSNVNTATDSFHGAGVLFFGHAEGSNYAGGQALTTLDSITLTGLPAGTNLLTIKGGSTLNFGEAMGGFTFDIGGLAGAVAGTKGDVDQWSSNDSSVIGFRSAGSDATQNSAAGFTGANAALFCGDADFKANSLVEGDTFSYTYVGAHKDAGINTMWAGTASGASNSANTTTTGKYGSGYAGGDGSISGHSAYGVNPRPWEKNGSTSGMYAGQFSYSGNGSGNVAGSSMSYQTTLPNGAIYGTHTSISVNVTH